MTVTLLFPHVQLEQERRKSNGLAQALQRVKEQHFTTQQQVEQEEEYIANRLLKRLEALKREKQARRCQLLELAAGHMLWRMYATRALKKERHAAYVQVLATEVEQEEEYLVNNLQKRMSKLHLEKSELEKTLEQQRRKVGGRCNLQPGGTEHTAVPSQQLCMHNARKLSCRGRRWRSCGWSR